MMGTLAEVLTLCEGLRQIWGIQMLQEFIKTMAEGQATAGWNRRGILG